MRVYFLAEKGGAFFVGGAYLGQVDLFERSVELDPKSELPCELQAAGYAPVHFLWNEEFLFSPPEGVILYFAKKSVAVYMLAPARADQTLSVLKQERVNHTLFTLCMQGKLTLNMENETGFHLLPLSEQFDRCEIFACGENFVVEGKERFLLLSHDGKKLVEENGKVLERGETLRAEIFFRDSSGHTALCEWKNGELVSCAIRTANEPTEATYALALFESVLIGADYTAFLSEELQKKADSLRGYLGKFESVVLTSRPDTVGLVVPRKERVYDVRFFRVTVTDGKVANITAV